MRGAGWRTPSHLREQNQRKLIQIMPGDFQHFIKSQACKSYSNDNIPVNIRDVLQKGVAVA